MRLRNKKTGEIIEGKCFTDIVKKLHERGDVLCYGSLLNVDLFTEYWKEIDSYEPKEPLIKDERTRRVIRAWAEVNSVEEVLYAERTDKSLFVLTDMGGDDTSIMFVGWVPTLKDGADYTIAELCGEEDYEED